MPGPDHDFGGTDACKAARQRLGQAASVIDAGDPHGRPVQQRALLQLAFLKRTRHGPEQMVGAELAFLACVQQGHPLQ